MAFTPGNQTASSNGTTAVTVCSTPGTGVTRLVRTVSIYNDESTAQTVTLRFDDGTNEFDILTQTLQPDESLLVGNVLVLTNGDTLETVLASGSSTNVEFTVHYADES